MNHSALHPAGLHAAQISSLGWFFFAVSAAVYIAVIVALSVVLLKRRRAGTDPGRMTHGERVALTWVGTAVAITTVLVTALAVSEFLTVRAMGSETGNPLDVRIVGHQWWWEIQYASDDPAGRIATANELHIPTGRPIHLQMTSQDVIHSFWVPNLQGKRDLIPGRTTHLTLVADEAGRYEGQCAEFCGFQHAKMRLVVEAQTAEDFEKWRQSQLNGAREPDDALRRRGRQVFEQTTCVMCHSIQGTSASGTVGPDLTHVASRAYLAAGTLPNTAENLQRWVINAPAIKPGTVMPATALPADDLHALLSYLRSLE